MARDYAYVCIHATRRRVHAVMQHFLYTAAIALTSVSRTGEIGRTFRPCHVRDNPRAKGLAAFVNGKADNLEESQRKNEDREPRWRDVLVKELPGARSAAHLPRVCLVQVKGSACEDCWVHTHDVEGLFLLRAPGLPRLETIIT